MTPRVQSNLIIYVIKIVSLSLACVIAEGVGWVLIRKPLCLCEDAGRRLNI